MAHLCLCDNDALLANSESLYDQNHKQKMSNVPSKRKPLEVLRLVQWIASLSLATRFATNAKAISTNVRLWKKNRLCITGTSALSVKNKPPTANIPQPPVCIIMKFEQLSDVMCGAVQ